MHNPHHPGEVIRRQCLEPLRLTVTEAAKGFGGSPESWLQQQMQYDLRQAKQREGEIRVRRFEAA